MEMSNLKIVSCSLTLYLLVIHLRALVHSCNVTILCSCCDQDGLSCNTVGECGGPCIDGYWGAKCIMKCPDECVKCDQNFGRIQECQICIDGRYGHNCSSECHNCKNCRKDEGDCINCANGYYGSRCQHNCSVTCLDLLCDFTDGRCNQCINGHYGFMCNEKCSDNCVNSSCDRHSGKCHACVIGYYGDNCTTECNPNCTDQLCDMSSGYCNDCLAGAFGDFCNKTCPVTCKASACDRDIGTCNNGCIDNFAGYHCAECKIGKYGDDCSHNCPLNCLNGECYRKNGICVSGCKSGYSDVRYCCANTTNCLFCSSGTDCLHCKHGTYGHTCGNNCSVNCNGTCDRSTGDCNHCISNYYGKRCQNACSETCLTTGYISSCKPDNGHCMLGCISGFYGNMCELPCSEHCKDVCYQHTGECESCKYDRFGKFCEHVCSAACGKLDAEPICRQSNGICFHGCLHGFYGEHCDINCSSNCKNVTCNIDTGYCLHGCLDGFYGDKCGDACSLSCQHMACNRSTGVCTYGCAQGLTGQSCVEAKETGQSSTTKLGIGAGIGVVFVAIVVVIILVVRKRHFKPGQGYAERVRKTQNPRKGRTGVYENVNPDETVDADSYIPDTVQVEVRDEHTYYNNAALKLRTDELYRYLSKSDETYQKEFQMLPNGLIKSYRDAKAPINAKRNRYNMVYPYDESRVKVRDGNSDYINASYIDGYKTKNAYIACLGPTKKILGDDFSLFWKMIWQEKVETIIMLTKLMEGSGMKCDQYWPNAGKSIRCGNVKVLSTGEEEYAEFIVRNMTISMDKEERQFHHIHFTAWPDKGVPSDVISIVNLRNKVLQMRRKFDGPLVVHCSAGIGRTGTYIALDILIRQGQAEQSVDVLGCVIKMREQRVHMVQTVDQYKYLHHAVLWSLSIDTEPVYADRFMDLSWIYQDDGLTKMLKATANSGYTFKTTLIAAVRSRT